MTSIFTPFESNGSTPVINTRQLGDLNVRQYRANTRTAGTRIYAGQYATRVGPNDYVVNDGRVQREPLQTRADVASFVRSPTTIRAALELLKGLALKREDFINAKSEQILLELLFQLAPDDLAAEMRKNKEFLLALFSSKSFSSLLHCIPQIMLHDGDIEREHRGAWFRRFSRGHVPKNDPNGTNDPTGDPAGPTTEQIVLAAQRRARTDWVRTASTVRNLVDSMNRTKKHKYGPKDAPCVELFEVDCKTKKPKKLLSMERISKVHTAA